MHATDPDRHRSCNTRGMPSFPPAPILQTAELLPLEEVERQHIMYVLELCHDQRTRAAQLLGIDRKTLYRRLVAYARTPARQNAAPARQSAATHAATGR